MTEAKKIFTAMGFSAAVPLDTLEFRQIADSPGYYRYAALCKDGGIRIYTVDWNQLEEIVIFQRYLPGSHIGKDELATRITLNAGIGTPIELRDNRRKEGRPTYHNCGTLVAVVRSEFPVSFYDAQWWLEFLAKRPRPATR